MVDVRVVETCWETSCNRCGEVLSSYFLNAELNVEITVTSSRLASTMAGPSSRMQVTTWTFLAALLMLLLPSLSLLCQKNIVIVGNLKLSVIRIS